MKYTGLLVLSNCRRHPNDSSYSTLLYKVVCSLMSGDPLSDYKELSAFDQWLVSMNCAVGTASQAQMTQYQAYRDDKYRLPMLDRCRATRDYLLKASPGVIYMLSELKKVGMFETIIYSLGDCS